MVLAMVAAACGGDGDDGGDENQGGETGEALKGGIVRWESEEFAFTNAFDPTGEYLGEAWSIYTNLMLRPLLGYSHTGGPEGNELVPDLAADMPDISEDGTTWTFTIRDGVKFGQPVDREIVCEDIEYAFHRIAADDLVAQYGFYYDNTIEGMGDAKTVEDPISGIKCNGDKEIEFTLTEPTGDFGYRVAMPATAPIPPEVGKCFTKAGDYGRFVISSSSYQFKGSADLDISSCDAMKPISGYDPTKEQVLERNPNYDQATDEYRENNFDEFHHILNTNTNDIEQKVLQNESEFLYTPTPGTLRKFAQDPELEERLHIESGDRTWYITMNLNEPPFDDINVRKAANFIMDKESLQRAWGGPDQGEIATHIVPDTMLNGILDDYDPYPSENHAGDEEAAKAAMKESIYDTDGDGICDAPECKGVLDIASNVPPNTDMAPTVQSSFEKIGIELDIREVTDAYTPIQTVSKRVPISHRPGWGKDYADAYTFVGFLFSGENILCTGNTNYSLVGFSEEQAKECKVPYTENGPIPSVDEDIAACVPEQGDARVECWAALVQKLMEEVVPWVPYLDANAVWATSDAVVKFEFDQFSSTPAWSKIAVDKSLQ